MTNRDTIRRRLGRNGITIYSENGQTVIIARHNKGNQHAHVSLTPDEAASAACRVLDDWLAEHGDPRSNQFANWRQQRAARIIAALDATKGVGSRGLSSQERFLR